MTPFQRLLVLYLLLPGISWAAIPGAEIHIEGGALEYATFASFGSRQIVSGVFNVPPSTIDARLCDEFLDYSAIDWQGDIILVPRGNCTFEFKALAAQQMGASSIIVYNTLESRYGQNNDTSVVYPLDKADYECNNGVSTITNLTLDPPMYNESYHDAFLTFDSPNNLCIVDDPSRCESQRCFVTGPKNITTGTFQACCAWDILMRMGPDASANVDNMVAVFITMRQAEIFLALPQNTTVTIQERPYSNVNASSFLLWMLGIFIVAFASWYSVRDYRKAKRQWQLCFQQSVQRHVAQQRQQQQQEQQQQDVSPMEEGEAGDLEEVAQTNEASCPNDEDMAQDNVHDVERPPTQNAESSDPEEAPEVVDENPELPPQQPQRTIRENRNQALELNAWHAAGFVIVASTVLLILFYFEIYSWVTVLYGFGCSGAMAQLIFQPSYSWIARRSKVLGKCCFAPITKMTCCELNTVQWVNIIAALTGYLVGAMWLYVGFTDVEPSLNPFYWITQNVMGACVAILFLSLIRLSNIKVATILLVATFIYDVFFVFITPYLFNGDSVMVTVATGGGPPEMDENFCEKYPDDSRCEGGNPLPLLLTIPRINDYRGGSSLLGLGDIVIPGLLVAFGARLDDARRLVGSLTNRNITVPKHFYNGYLFPLVVAYGVGLLAANIAVVLMQRGQPALLYLVPACLGTVFIVGRSELGELWRGPEVIRTADRITRLDPTPASLRVTREPEQNDAETTETEQDTVISGSARSIS